MTKLVANMVIRNESENYLKQVLARVVEQVDLLCVTDDCSDDDSAEIAESFGAKVWRMSEPTFTVHEGRLRQASWDHLEDQITKDEPWYVLAIDADEELYEGKYPLRYLIDQPFNVLGIEFFHMWTPTHFRIDKAWRPHGSQRLFRYFPGGKFFEKRLACGSEPSYVIQQLRNGSYVPTTDLRMKHLSYIKDEDKQKKYERYMALDGGAFHANAHIQSILDPNPQLVEWTYGD